MNPIRFDLAGTDEFGYLIRILSVDSDQFKVAINLLILIFQR